MRALRAAVAVALLLPLAGCGSGVLVDAYPREEGTDLDCQVLLADAPPTLAGLERRQVADDVEAAAWGDPPVIVRCGVEDPEALEPTSSCEVVDDVGWFSETTADGFLFTTIGRRFNVSVEVPAAHQPPADALVDLAATIERHDPVEQPCV